MTQAMIDCGVQNNTIDTYNNGLSKVWGNYSDPSQVKLND
jgi:hypothetical protein